MSTWHIVIGVILFIIFASYMALYVALAYSQKLSAQGLNEPAPPDLSEAQGEEYKQSVRNDMQTVHYLQCGMMVILTVILALVDTHYFVMASMFTASLAAAHYYFGRSIVP